MTVIMILTPASCVRKERVLLYPVF